MESGPYGRAHKVEAENYSVAFYPISETCWRHDFVKFLRKREHRFDAFPDEWNLGLVRDLPKGRVVLYGLYGKLSLEGTWMLFLPSFSVLSWELGVGKFTIESIRSTDVLPEDLPTIPVAFPYLGKGLPTGIDEVIRVIRQARDVVPICRCLSPSSVSRRAKEFIARHYAGPLSMSDTAAALGFNRGTMSRSFSRDYGLSPTEYRNALRISASLKLLALGEKNITEVSNLAGFSDLSTFGKQFKKVIEYHPSGFRWSSRSRRDTLHGRDLRP